MLKRPAFAFTAILMGLLLAAPAQAEEHSVTIATGSPTGVYYPAGGAICRLLSYRSRKENGVRCFVESTGGSIDNLQALRDNEVTFAIVQSDWQYAAYRGEGIFTGQPFADLRSVFSLHSEMFTIAVSRKSGIKSFDDLKGKRVNVGDQGSGMRAIMDEMMKSKGWTSQSFTLASGMKPTVAAEALCNGKLDAMIFAAGHPNGLIQEVTTKCGAKLIPVEGPEVDKLLADNPYYARTAIPGGMYAGNPQNTPTFGVKATLVTTAGADEEAVYQLTKSVFENFDTFKTLHFVFATLDKDRMVTSGLIAPIHPGALRYYREAGLIKDEAK